MLAFFIKKFIDEAIDYLREKGIENIIPIPVGSTLTPLNVKLADNQETLEEVSDDEF